MKNLILFLLMSCSVVIVWAQQSMEQTMETRAREFHRVIGLPDKAAYKKFMQENYTKGFLEKPMNMNRVVTETDGSSSNTSSDKEKSIDNLDAKAQMYVQLHNDFGGKAITSLTKKENKMELLIKSAGLKGKFTFTFSKESPYLIEGLSIEADMQN